MALKASTFRDLFWSRFTERIDDPDNILSLEEQNVQGKHRERRLLMVDEHWHYPIEVRTDTSHKGKAILFNDGEKKSLKPDRLLEVTIGFGHAKGSHAERLADMLISGLGKLRREFHTSNRFEK